MLKGNVNRPNVLIGRNLLQQIWQHGRITDVAGGDLDRPNLQCFFIDPYVYFALDPLLLATMLARVPLAFALCLDPRTVNQRVQRASPTVIGDGDAQRLLTTA